MRPVNRDILLSHLYYTTDYLVSVGRKSFKKPISFYTVLEVSPEVKLKKSEVKKMLDENMRYLLKGRLGIKRQRGYFRFPNGVHMFNNSYIK